MLTLNVDLHSLTFDELVEAREALHQDVREAEAHDPAHRHPELLQLFAAIESAVRAEVAERAAAQHLTQHEITEALGIDEETGEGPGA